MSKKFYVNKVYRLKGNPECTAVYLGQNVGMGTKSSHYENVQVHMTDRSAWEQLTEISPPEVTATSNLVGSRSFESGANRNSDEGKLDFEGFLSPSVLKKYAEYMHKNRKLEDGSLRDSDNWQKGIPKDVYMKSMWRHFFDVWSSSRGLETEEDQATNLCALMFNAMGMLHELLREENEN